MPKSLVYGSLNPNCPHCSARLVATVTATYWLVPLSDDGYDITEGRLQEDEVLSVECRQCQTFVPISHYYGKKEETAHED